MKQTLALPFALAAFANCALAIEPAVVSVRGGVETQPNADSCYGWGFYVNTPIVVTALGVYDYGNDGLRSDHPIGLFQGLFNGQLLASGTIRAGTGDPLADGFRYVSTPSVLLNVGEAYVICYYSGFTPGDLQLLAPWESVDMYGDVIFLVPSFGRWEPATGGLTFPSSFIDSREYPIGPNFLWHLAPEPTACTLFGLGSLMLVMNRKRGLAGVDCRQRACGTQGRAKR